MNFTLPADFTAEISGYYISGGISGSWVFPSSGELNLGLQKELPGNNGQVKLSITNILLSNDWRWSSFQPEHNYYNRGSYVAGERVFKLTYGRNFGNSKVKKALERTTGSEEERSRVN